MNIFEFLRIDAALEDIDLAMTPVEAYGLFECRGDMHRVRSRKERYYYFYINNWEKTASLCFMERGIRHAKVLARINAPQKMIDECVAAQGKTYKENSFSIDDHLRIWLKRHVITQADAEKIIPLEGHKSIDQPFDLLPENNECEQGKNQIFLRSESRIIVESEIPALIRKYDFFEKTHNPGGTFQNCLSRTRDAESVYDIKTRLVWQRGGSDISSARQLQGWLLENNHNKISGYDNWRLPTIEEALSLIGRVKGRHGLYIHPCFDPKQGYIYTADRRKPGGYWFVDFRQAKVFWASGTFAGGFGRICRTECLPQPEKVNTLSSRN